MSDLLKGDKQQPLIIKQYETFEEFYQDIPLDGSLGILAHGASAILAWKRKRQEAGWVPPMPVPEKPRKKRKKGDKKDE